MSGPEKKTIISVQSRKGGVGKTSIALSAAAQLAGHGFRVVFLDLDGLGSHLSQALPTERDYRLANGSFELAPQYERRPWSSWRATGNPFHEGIPQIGELLDKLLLVENIRHHADQLGVSNRDFERLNSHLSFLLFSCYLRDINDFNNLVGTQQGNTAIRQYLESVVRDLDADFVIIDNSPGLAFNGGVCLSWALSNAMLAPEDTVHTWFVTQTPWWEQGLVIYETNIYQDHLARAHPRLVINRVRKNSWCGLLPGTDYSLRRGEDGSYLSTNGPDAARALARRLQMIPIWKGSDVPSTDYEEEIFADFSISAISEDDIVTNAMRGGESDANTHEFQQMMEVLVGGLLVEPLSGARSVFHDNVRTALLEPFLPPDA